MKLSDPSNGSLTLNSDGSFAYTPAAGFLDQFISLVDQEVEPLAEHSVDYGPYENYQLE